MKNIGSILKELASRGPATRERVGLYFSAASDSDASWNARCVDEGCYVLRQDREPRDRSFVELRESSCREEEEKNQTR